MLSVMSTRIKRKLIKKKKKGLKVSHLLLIREKTHREQSVNY